MPTSNERIAAGIQARNLGELNSRTLQSFAGKPKSLADLIEAASTADLKAKCFAESIQKIEAEFAKRTEAANARFADISSLPKAERERLAKEEISKYRIAALKLSSDERYAALKELKEIESAVEAVAELYASPVHMLAQHNLGGEARSRYYEQIAHAGPTELTTFARRAVNLGDRDLAAAVANRFDALDSSGRKSVQFSKQDLAAAVMGAEFVKASEAIAVAKNRLQESLNLNRKLENGRQSGGARIRQALNRQREGVSDLPEDA